MGWLQKMTPSLLFIKGTKVGDAVECKAISDVFCRNRQTSLMIGSVRSNMGHGENSSAISSIIKSIFALESGRIAPNISFKNPKSEIESLISGRMKVVIDIEKLEGPLIGINSFGIGGTNGM
jgi:fatty acid synthase